MTLICIKTMIMNENGGSFMTNDIILEVKKAEQNATRIEKEAKDQRDSMIEKASTEAKDMLAKAISETRQKNKDALEKVEAEGEKAIQMAIQTAEKEILLMKSLLADKEEKAMQLILAEII